MKKLVYSMLLLTSLYIGWGFSNRVRGDQIPDNLVPNGMSYTMVISSRQVFRGNGTLYRLEWSTGNGADFFQVFDTNTVPSVTLAALVTSTINSNGQTLFPSIVTPPYVFTSTVVASVGAVASGLGGVRDFSPYGIYISTGLYILNNNSANQVEVYWKR